MLDRRRRRKDDFVQMLYKRFVFAGRIRSQRIYQPFLARSILVIRKYRDIDQIVFNGVPDSQTMIEHLNNIS